MDKLLKDLKDYLKWQEIATDTMIFRLHNRFTAVVLLIFSTTITATQYVGDPIQCIVDGMSKEAKKVVNTYCWITTTFTIPNATDAMVGEEVPAPGVMNDYKHESKYYAYYQWVCFVLLFQAILCYAPNWLWNYWENGLMKSLVMNSNNPMCPAAEGAKMKSTIMKYFLDHRLTHKLYVYRYYACEALCLVNILFQLYLINRFFAGQFMSYGLRLMDSMNTPQEERHDPLIYIFPRVTSCIFHKYGPSGGIQKYYSLCILPLNIVNEKIYVFIWFWYLILLVLLVGLLIYRAAIIFKPSVRPHLMHFLSRGTPKEICESITRKTDIGDWWVLYCLGTNMDALFYRDLLQELAKKMGDQNSQPIA